GFFGELRECLAPAGHRVEPEAIDHLIKSLSESPAIDRTGFKKNERSSSLAWAFRCLASDFAGLGGGFTPLPCVAFAQFFGAALPVGCLANLADMFGRSLVSIPICEFPYHLLPVCSPDGYNWMHAAGERRPPKPAPGQSS